MQDELVEASRRLHTKYDTDPVAFSREILGAVLWQKQEEIMQAVWDHAYVVVQSCYGSGKSFVAAQVALAYLYTHVPAKVIVTSSSWTQVEKILFAEILSAFNRCKIPLGGKTKTVSIELEKDWFVIGISPKIDVDSEAYRFEGFHSPNVLVIMDQAQGINPKLWEVATSLVTTESSRILVLGNPISPTGKFYETCTKAGLWHKIKICAADTPNIKEGREVIPGLITQKWVDDRKEDWGVANPLYISKVLADFPDEAEDILISLSLVEEAKLRELKADGALGLGVDVARFGACKTVFTVVHGKKVVDIMSYQGKDTMQTAGWTKRLMERWNIPDFAVCIDDTGLGGGVVDRLREDGFKVNPINNQASATDPEHFFNISSEMHWHLRRLFETGNIDIPDHPLLASQLPGRKYSVTSRGKGQIKIESKEDMEKRGLKSPDFPDSLVLAIKAQELFNKPAQGPSLYVC